MAYVNDDEIEVEVIIENGEFHIILVSMKKCSLICIIKMIVLGLEIAYKQKILCSMEEEHTLICIVEVVVLSLVSALYITISHTMDEGSHYYFIVYFNKELSFYKFFISIQ